MPIAKLVLALMLTLLLVNGGCSSAEKDPQSLYEKALGHIEKNETKEAIFELRRAIQQDARFADARYRLGLLYLENSEPQKAFEELVRAAELAPENVDAAFRVAQFYFFGGNKEECRRHLDQVFAQEPLHRGALGLLANLELNLENYDLAMAALDKVGDAVNESAELLNTKGRIFAAQEKWDQAEIFFRKALEVDPDGKANYANLLRLYETRQQIDKAKALLDEMVVRFPDDAQSRLLLAGYHRAVGEVENTEEALLEVVELAPSVPRHRLTLAQFYRDNRKLDKAEAVLLQAGSDFSEDSDIQATLGDLYFDLGRVDDVRQIVEKIDADHPGGTLLRARLMLLDGQLRESVSALKKLVTDYPAWGDANYYLGLAHYRLGELDQAKFAVAEAIQKKKNDPKYYALMAQLHLAQGAFEDAEKEAATALQLNSRNFPTALLFGRSLLGQKKFDQALTVYQDMNRQVPDNVEVLVGLAQAAYGSGDEERGEAVVDELLKRDPGNIQGIGMVLVQRYGKNLAGAEEFVRAQQASQPESYPLALLLGGLLEQRGKTDEALSAYEKAQQLQPEDMRAYFAAARVLKRLGKSDEAMTKYQTMIEKQPNALAGHMGIASLLEAEGDVAGAMSHYEKMLEIKADFGPAANNLAWLIATDPDGDLGKALMLAMTARQAMPDDPNVADTLGYVHLQRQSYSLAISQFEVAMQKNPEEPMFAFHLAQALRGDGQQDKARQVLEELLARDGQFSARAEAEALLQELRAN